MEAVPTEEDTVTPLQVEEQAYSAEAATLNTGHHADLACSG